MKQATKTIGDTRLIIGFWGLAIFLIFLLISVVYLKQIVYYQLVDFIDGWKIFGRIFFVLSFYICGLSIRAFRFYAIGKTQTLKKSDPWKVYLFDYGLIIGSVASVFIFSLITSIESISSTVVFYLFSASASIMAGSKGYGFLEKEMNG